jgi:hypothetical protein
MTIAVNDDAFVKRNSYNNAARAQHMAGLTSDNDAN